MKNREQFNQEAQFLQRLVHARSANPFTPGTSLPDAPVEEEVATLQAQWQTACQT